MAGDPLAGGIGVDAEVFGKVHFSAEAHQLHGYAEQIHHHPHRCHAAAKVEGFPAQPQGFFRMVLVHTFDFQQQVFSPVMLTKQPKGGRADALAATYRTDRQIVDEDQIAVVDGGGDAGKFSAPADAPYVKNTLAVLAYDGGKGLAFLLREGAAVQPVDLQPVGELGGCL